MNNFLRLVQSKIKSAITAPTNMPPVNQLNCLVTSVMDWPKCSAMGPDSIPMGASMEESRNYVRNDTSVMTT